MRTTTGAKGENLELEHFTRISPGYPSRRGGGGVLEPFLSNWAISRILHIDISSPCAVAFCLLCCPAVQLAVAMAVSKLVLARTPSR